MYRYSRILLFVLLMPFWCSAQQSTLFGVLAGTVTDNTHLPIAEAAIIAVNPATEESRRAITAGNGDFQIIGLPVGTYDLRVNAPGFADYTHTGVVLAMGQTVRLAVALALSQVNTQITVTTSPSPLDVTQTSVTTAIDHERIEELPVRTRNALDFVLLAPGVSATRMGSGATSQGASSSSGFSFAGLRARSNNISIDA